MSALAADLAASLDPVVLARRLDITPDPWQARLLRSTAPRTLLNVTRQGGKSTITSLLAVHEALYHAGALVLLLSPSMRQSGEIFLKCLHAYKGLGRPVPSVSETALTLTLANGSRIVSLPGSTDATIRGYSGVSLLIIDEASRVDDGLYMSVRPMLAVSGGRLIALSTPYGKRGWWFDAWTGDEPWERFRVPATDCPRIAPAFLAEEQRTLGPWFFRQEYCCEFSETTDQLFTHDVVMAAITPEVKPLFGGRLTWDIETTPR